MKKIEPVLMSAGVWVDGNVISRVRAIPILPILPFQGARLPDQPRTQNSDNGRSSLLSLRLFGLTENDGAWHSVLLCRPLRTADSFSWVPVGASGHGA